MTEQLQASLKDKIVNNGCEDVSWDEYAVFVDNNLSGCGKDKERFKARIDQLYEEGVNAVPLQLCLGAVAFEGGEAADLMKKVVYHEKPWTPEIKDKLIKELGDVLWYLQGAVSSLGLSLEDIKTENVRKISERYPEGYFTFERAEKRG